jgi:lysozyme
MDQATGIDVSGENGPWNWEPFAGHDHFAAIRATSWNGRTLGIDPQFLRNWREAGDKGLRRIAYHEIRPDVLANARTQALTVSALVHDAGLDKTDCTAMVIDPPYCQGLAPAEVSGFALEYGMDINGDMPFHRLLVYIDPNLASLGYARGLSRWHLWIAQYEVSEPTVPDEWADNGLSWTIWQTQGAIPPDRDVFNGDARAYDEFALAWHPAS